jgi:MFS family permease
MEQKKFKVGGKRATFVLIICSLLYCVNWMDRQVFSVVTAPMMYDLNLTKTQVGWIQNAFLLSIGFFAIPISYLVDRWSRAKSISLMAMLWSAATFITGLGSSFMSVLIPRVSVGVGEAGFGPGGTALIGASYKPEERGHKLGYFNMAIAAGVMIGLVLGGFVAQRWGWAAAFFVFAIPGIILGILALFMQDYPTRPKAETGASFWKNFITLAKIPTLRWLYFGWGLYMLTIMAVAHWNVALLIFKFKLGVAQASNIMAGILFVSLFAYPLGGWLSDKWEKKHPGGRMRYAALCSFGGAITAVLYFYFAFILYTGTFWEWGGLLIVGLLFYLLHTLIIAGVGGPVGATTQMVVPVHLKSLSFGVGMTCMYGLGGGWGSGIAGMIADSVGTGQRGDWLGLTYGLMVVCTVAVLAGFCWLRAAHHYKTDIQKAHS